MKAKEFIDSTSCYIKKAYNHHSKDTYHNAFSKHDAADKLNNFLENNPTIKVIDITYSQGVTHEEKMLVNVSKIFLTYKEIDL
jgi:hypothetical protein